ncbi:MAG TPA: alpha/beta fold hydrolase [Bacteroidetes bacterium]|nr:alpha/beta fold hydrolase [Bacteroidota bacterium]
MSINALEYRPPWLLRNHHLSTIYPALFRKVKEVNYQRERIDTPDGDFLDLDFSKVGSNTLLIAVHGLEGNADAPYIRGLVRQTNVRGWDALAINLRGCSGEPNKVFASYHSGQSSDLSLIIEHILDRHSDYTHLFLAGFSLGGNICLKFAGEKAGDIPAKLRGLVAVSVPTNLMASAHHLARLSNWAYMRHFLITLKRKALEKKDRFPDAPFSKADIRRARNFVDYDNMYTAPSHGFRDAEDYWTQSASAQFIPAIQLPTLIINALNDPFLPEVCYPYAEVASNAHVTLETPKYGGHVGFVSDLRMQRPFWQEKKILDFFAGHLS